MEFSVWSDLIYQSGGLLHVFLPLLDRGLDAVIHRLTDGVYIPVQVKGRNENAMGEVHLVVPGESLVDDNALLIASELGNVEHQMDLVVPEGVFKQLANLDVIDGKEPGSISIFLWGAWRRCSSLIATTTRSRALSS